MEEDLAKLNIIDEEEEAFIEEASVVERSYQLCLVGRYLTDSVVHLPSMRNTMEDLWHPIGRICISDLRNKRFLFQFFHEVEMQRVLSGTPWFFNNHLLILHLIQDGEDPLEVPLQFTEFWIQVHDLPPGMMTTTMAKYGATSEHCDELVVKGGGWLLAWGGVFALQGRAAGHNEGPQLKRSWFGKTTDDIDAIGSKGGLSLGWKRNELIQLKSYSSFHIDVEERGRFLSTSIRERLDRGVVSLDWISLFSSHQLEHLSHSFSDHCLILLDTHGCDLEGQRPRPSMFRFEAKWCLEHNFEEVVLSNWNSFDGNIPDKLRFMGQQLILRLEREDGSRVSTNEEMLQLASRYFENLFTASSSGDDVRLLGLVDKRISNDMNEELLKPFMEEDILHDVKSMPPLKAPGIDGFSTIFFQNYWHIVGPEVSRSPEEIVNTVLGKEMSGDFETMEDQNEIALLEEDLIQLTVKSSPVVPSKNPTLICSVWMRKTSILRPIINHIRVMRNQFEDVSYLFVPRTANSAAHTLALEGRRQQIACSWFHDPPNSVQKVMDKDWEEWVHRG
ncbi:hypothetical protein GOBAR_AA09834 [Gossypium barbadense]|uniref:DUF4283 domain-containing protein n=1 Tax=Gossypium barbadense TaxID=3634 RepID=A0A2P5Y5E2_GOSBA|nr:hypothetical protein GOBAR_AA09834 [Gossypium barbadense]